ncbi:MAG: GGDEF domain-containing protein [Candidatus Omnitrophica bacterium]|nr:GGDEF domain-containing protein [Candidatus Omnitrophota bacterium]
MKLSFFKTRYILYSILISVISWFLFNFLLQSQSVIMYKYFIEKPANYNLERAERLAAAIYQSFQKEVPTPSIPAIESFISKYNDIPFLSVNFIYKDKDGIMKSVLRDVKQIDILSAEYVYPIQYDGKDTGTLLVYDINKEYKKGLQEYTHMMNLTRWSFAFLLVLIFSILLYREYSEKIEKEKRIAEYRAVHDGLTGLYTQKYFKEHLEKEIMRCQRYNRPVSLIMCDIDNFKIFNDSYGHLAGDCILHTVAQIMATNVRASDTVVRYGGEEFAIMLIEAGIAEVESVSRRMKDLTEQAMDIAGRIKNKIEHTKIEVKDKRVNVTISMGIASYDGSPNYKSEHLISEADLALYESKKNGRNQITLFDPETKQFIRFL